MVSLVVAGAAPMARPAAVNGATLPGSRTLVVTARTAGRPAFACAADPAAATAIVVAASAVAAMMLRGDLMLAPCYGELPSGCAQQWEVKVTVRSRRGEILNRHAAAAGDLPGTLRRRRVVLP